MALGDYVDSYGDTVPLVQPTLPPVPLAYDVNGNLVFTGATSGSTVLKATAVAGGTLTLPPATDTLVGRSTTDTLLNKSISASQVNSGTLAAARLPTPGAATLGGTFSKAAVTNQWINTISTAGAPSSTQPSTADLSTEASNGSAAAGNLGQIITGSLASGSGVSLTTAVTANVLSISLTAGDWDVAGTVAFLPAGTTSVTLTAGGNNTTSATMPTADDGPYFRVPVAAFVPGAFPIAYCLTTVRYSLSATTTVYLVAVSNFTVSTMKAFGYIQARRAR